MSTLKNKYALGVDIGGSHIAAAIVDINKKKIIPHTKIKTGLDSSQDAFTILTIWVQCIEKCMLKFGSHSIEGIGISIPGPANYEEGISEITGCNKYEKLYGVDLRTTLYAKVKSWIDHPEKISFINDAASFLIGETWSNDINNDRIVAITLGTGIGSGFMTKGRIITSSNNIPERGEIFSLPFKNKRAEDWISTKWFLESYKKHFGKTVKNVKEIAYQAAASEEIRNIFNEFGSNLGTFLSPILGDFNAKTLIFGGNVTKSYNLFQESFENCFNENLPRIHFAENTENSAILGAVKNLTTNAKITSERRLTQQYLMPIKFDSNKKKETYDIYPSFEIEKGSIDHGFHSLAKKISTHKSLCIEGYIGVDWSSFMSNLICALEDIGTKSIAYSTRCAFKKSNKIDKMIDPFLGGNDPVFGRLFPGELSDFIDLDKLDNIRPNSDTLSILYGTGASLSAWDAQIIYVDIPKNEIQYRSRAGNVLNIGAKSNLTSKEQYKRMFFVDWPVLNKHKESILKKIDYIVDGQYLEDISWCDSVTLQNNLKEITESAFRIRPWFESGVWGGDWIKKRIEGLNKGAINYAWSFEFITPENGVVLSQNGIRLELSFDTLMYYDNKAILGDAASIFGTEFPIRFDFLDTFNGDNLSLQCHPKPNFIQQQFLEKFTQDETYYMLDAADDAKVYLGFQNDIDKEEFHQALLQSDRQGTTIEIEKYVQVHPAKKHDLFLIPHGTIHCSGKNGMVLEISSTPYIYTFKMYDWMRKDLDGNPRPLNISRGMQNLNFECKGKKVQEDYISKQTIIKSGADWKIVQLRTHALHFYAIYRLEFKNSLNVETKGQCHILNLVEGAKIKIITGNRNMIVHYAETFIVPSNAKNYQLINLGEKEVKVVQSFVKPEYCNNER